jgi:hypothetical protein
VLLFVGDVSHYPFNFDVEPLDLLLRSFDLEESIHEGPVCRLRPRPLPDILSRLPKKVELCQEGVFDDLIPAEFGARRLECGGGGVVAIERVPDCL